MASVESQSRTGKIDRNDLKFFTLFCFSFLKTSRNFPLPFVSKFIVRAYIEPQIVLIAAQPPNQTFQMLKEARKYLIARSSLKNHKLCCVWLTHRFGHPPFRKQHREEKGRGAMSFLMMFKQFQFFTCAAVAGCYTSWLRNLSCCLRLFRPAFH